MSYSLYVVVKNGTAIIRTEGYVAPPDGHYQINGHVPTGEPNNYNAETISATRFDENGYIIVQSAAVARK